MRFQDLCLIYESALKLIAGNFGKPLTAANYDKSIKANIANSNSSNYASIHYFLGNPNKADGCFLNLFYIITRTAEALPKSFKYEIPEKTLKRFRTQREIYNKHPAYLAGRYNVFYFNGKAIPKIFPEKDLQAEMANLIEVNNYFVQNYGKEYAFLGDVYRTGDESTFNKIASNWEKNKEDIRNLPKYFKDYFSNII
jgi:hypothetical protein